MLVLWILSVLTLIALTMIYLFKIQFLPVCIVGIKPTLVFAQVKSHLFI